MSDVPSPELVFALIGAVGTPLDDVARAVDDAMTCVAYRCTHIRVSELFAFFGFDINSSREDDRIRQAMDAGDEIRAQTGRADIMAALAIGKLQLERESAKQPLEHEAAADRRCYVIRSLKNPDEVDALRRIYRERLVVIAVHAPENDREENLRAKIARSHAGRPADFVKEASDLMRRDQRDERDVGKFGQNVRGAFPLADFFVTATRDLAPQTERLVGLLFGRPIITPTRDEAAMFHADAASLRSAALGRQVGAAIASAEGEVVAVGCNEVPRAFGGQYWDADEPDGRDFRSGFDQSDVGKIEVLQELLERLEKSGLLTVGPTWKDVRGLVQAITRRDAEAPPLADTRAMSLTEFTRDVHAEGAALMTAARHGLPVRGATLYATTFPCHNCSKHILAAGIARVVYIEPYPKSYAYQFYRESIEPERDSTSKVGFVPFTGVAPRRYAEWFRMTRKRKDVHGQRTPWSGRDALPSFLERDVNSEYLQREDLFLDEVRSPIENLQERMKSAVDSPTVETTS